MEVEKSSPSPRWHPHLQVTQFARKRSLPIWESVFLKTPSRISTSCQQFAAPLR
jgi:hypothetical protein